MVWDYSSDHGVCSLVFIVGKMDHEIYIQILRENLHDSAEKMGFRNTLWFYLHYNRSTNSDKLENGYYITA